MVMQNMPRGSTPNLIEEIKQALQKATPTSRKVPEEWALADIYLKTNARDWLFYLLSELDAANAKLLVYQQDNEMLEATVTELESKLDASEERMRNRHDSHIVAMWELEQKYKAELDTVKQEKAELQAIVDHQGISILERRKQIETLKQENERLQKHIEKIERAGYV